MLISLLVYFYFIYKIIFIQIYLIKKYILNLINL